MQEMRRERLNRGGCCPYRGYRMRTSPIRHVLASVAIIGVGALMVYEIMSRFRAWLPTLWVLPNDEAGRATQLLAVRSFMNDDKSEVAARRTELGSICRRNH
jgi:hypothetical protein